ncbi:MAG: outer membrane protein assembly factor BamD [Puniceicoccales bacterium]|jgi:outer membrane protein assembly factor BamD (BamD/ComL family)|nr:outer membrane protein assembly factor BamD [Puniceicoccales bacterium]
MRALSSVFIGLGLLALIHDSEARPRFGAQRRTGGAERSRQVFTDAAEREENLRKSYEEACGLQERGEARRARRLFQQLENARDATWSPLALWQIASIYEVSHQYLYAVNQLRKILDQYPDYEYFNDVVERIFQIAAQLQSGQRPHYFGLIPGFRDPKSAIDFYQNVVQRAPSSPWSAQALLCIAQIEREQKRPHKAIEALDRLMDRYPQSALAPEAYLFTAEIYESLVLSPEYDQGALGEALSYYEDFSFLFPEHEKCRWAQGQIAHLKASLARAKIHMGDFYYFSQNNWPAADLLYGEALVLHPSREIVEEIETKRQWLRQGQSAPKSPVDFLFDFREQDAKNQRWLASLSPSASPKNPDDSTQNLDGETRGPDDGPLLAPEGSSTPSSQERTGKSRTNTGLSRRLREKKPEDFLPPSADSTGPALDLKPTQVQLSSGF